MSGAGIPTQSAIAAAAGVSRSTVSRALIHHPAIPQATRDRIGKIAAELGYRPDPLVTANMLRVRSAGHLRVQAVLGYLTARAFGPRRDGNISQHLYLESARQRAEQLGFSLDVITLDDPRLTGSRCTNILLARGLSGLLVAPMENPYVRLRLDWSKFAAASIGFPLLSPRLSFAANNHSHTMSLALGNLRRLGYRRIGLAIPSRADHYAGEAFSAVYCLFAETHQKQARIPRLVPHLRQWNRTSFLAWYKEHRPDAVVCITNDVRDWLSSQGIGAPDDVGLVHLNWNQLKDDWSGVNEHNDLVGSAAVQLISNQLVCNERGIPAFPQSILIEGEWVPGATVRRLLPPGEALAQRGAQGKGRARPRKT